MPMRLVAFGGAALGGGDVGAALEQLRGEAGRDDGRLRVDGQRGVGNGERRRGPGR